MTRRKQDMWGDGCDVHAHCLTCPLQYCIYDDERAGPKPRFSMVVAGVGLTEREAQVVRFLQGNPGGHTYDELAAHVGVTRNAATGYVSQVRQKLGEGVITREWGSGGWQLSWSGATAETGAAR